MGDCCNCGSEAKRDGSGQLSRYLKALDPSYALIDDRSIDDLLVFTKRYANQIRFYDIPDSNPGGETDPTKISWREFFHRDMAVIAASISLTDTAQIKKDYDELRVKLDANPSYNTFGDLFDPILGMLVKLDGWYSIAIPENPLYADMQLAINSNLKWQAQQTVAYEKGFNYVDASHPLNLDYTAIKNKTLWGLDGTINADVTIFTGTDAEDKIRNGALYVDDIFNNFYSFLNQLLANSEGYMQFALQQYPSHQPHMALFLAFLQLFRLAQDQMNGITGRMLDFYYHDVLHLTPKPSIPDKVHIVFELTKDITEYDVAAGTSLKAGKDAGGKDQLYVTETDLVVNQAKVKEIKSLFIETTAQAMVQADGTTASQKVITNFYARPVANSQDGFGAPINDVSKMWPSFGKGNAVNPSNNLCDQIATLDDAARIDAAEVGFAIASPQLVMQGGNRLLQIHLTPGTNVNLFATAKAFETQNSDESFFIVSLTGDKGWLEVDNVLTADQFNQLFIQYAPAGATPQTLGIFNPALNIPSASYYLDDANNAINVYLPPTEQSIINFDAKLHSGYPLQTTLPVAKILINPDAGINVDDFQTFTLKRIDIRTKVGSINPSEQQQQEIIKSEAIPNASDLFTYHSDGLKKLVLQNKDGVLPPDKPFDPFTAYPFPGRSLYIGSDEVFDKPFGSVADDAIAINISKTLDSAGATFANNQDWEDYTVSILKQRQWNLITDANGAALFSRVKLTQNILNESVLLINREPIDTVTEWKSNTEKDFIKIDLRQQQPEFELKKGRDIFAAAAENTSVLQTSQNLAPGLEIKEISVSYDSTMTFKMGVDQFFHIYPFGAIETFLLLPSFQKRLVNDNGFAELNKEKNGLLVSARNTLLPQFNFQNPYSKYYSAAILSNGPSISILNGVLGKGADRTYANSRSANAVRLLLSERSDTVNATNQYTGDLQEGSLYIGIENLQPLQSISMLFQFAEGSADDEDDDPPPINWSYLSNNEWIPMKAEAIVSDGTYGFQTTGIVKIDVPADATANNTIVTNTLTWLCASVTENANRIPQLIDIVTQAVEAQFQDNNNDPSHFDDALPAGSIAKLNKPVAEINTVKQPFASFDGKHQEVGKEFYTRVSERLRHKGRAITAWDYEHLVLDRFPSIYKVKCITHTDPNCLCRNKETSGSTEKQFQLTAHNFEFDAAGEATIAAIINELKSFAQLKATITCGDQDGDINTATTLAKIIQDRLTAGGSIDASRIIVGPFDANKPTDTATVTLGDYIIATADACCGPQVAPGHVLIIPVSDLKNRNAVNPLQPKTSRRTLIAIQEYLQTRTSPFVHVHAKNPVYEQIIVSFKVQFYSGIDKGYYIKKLNDEIVNFLTPWAFDENADVKFNQKIYASSIINFIEERSYVDFITDFVMGVCCNECCAPVTEMQGGGVIQGNVYDDEAKQKPLAGVAVKIKQLNRTTITDVNGSYKFTSIPPGNYTLIAYFSLFNMAKEDFSIPDPPVPGTPLPIPDFIRGGEQAGYSPDEISAFFSKLCSCSDIEQILESDPNFNGDIVAEPCTSRSLLVSVPKHIIVPYEEDDEPTPCEKRKAARTSNRIPLDVLAGPRVSIASALSPAKPVAAATRISTPFKSAPVNKASAAARPKPASTGSSKKTKPAPTKPGVKPKKPK
jgi:hypothetical protein